MMKKENIKDRLHKIKHYVSFSYLLVSLHISAVIDLFSSYSSLEVEEEDENE